MKRIVCMCLLAGAFCPGVLVAQKDLSRATWQEIVAHIKANQFDGTGLDAAVAVLTQLRGPAERAELDAFADDLVALIVSGEGFDSFNAEWVLVAAARAEQEGMVPYEGAYDAMMRAYLQRQEAGKWAGQEVQGLVRIDPVRGLAFAAELAKGGDDDSCLVRDELSRVLEGQLRTGYLDDLCHSGSTRYPMAARRLWPSYTNTFTGMWLRFGRLAHYVRARPYPEVWYVFACSPAHHAGVQQGDRLLSVNGRDAREDIPVPEFGAPDSDFVVRHAEGGPGTEHRISVDRNGTVLTMELESIEMPPHTSTCGVTVASWQQVAWLYGLDSETASPGSVSWEADGTPADLGCPATPRRMTGR